MNGKPRREVRGGVLSFFGFDEVDMQINTTEAIFIVLFVIVTIGGFIISDLLGLSLKRGSSNSTVAFRIILRGVVTVIGTIQGYIYKIPAWLLISNLFIVGVSCLATVLIQNHLNQRYPISPLQRGKYDNLKIRYQFLFLMVSISGSLQFLHYMSLSPIWAIPFSVALSCISYAFFSDEEPFYKHCLIFVSLATFFVFDAYSRSK